MLSHLDLRRPVLIRRSAVILVFLIIAGCAAISQQKSMPAQPDNLEFHNLRVLSPNITHDELIATMRGISRSLGTRCEHCHVQTATEPRPEFDFPNDAKPEKKAARTMLLMTRAVNTNYISRVNAHGEGVTCFTCHRGHTVPETAPAAPAQQRPGAPPAAPNAAPSAAPPANPPANPPTSTQ
jgi:Photosynthetic reaction centre cytochrome C subunit